MPDNRYLRLLSKDYPNAESVIAEIINLSAVCELPKGTEYFFSDIHGESDAFSYQLRTASGVLQSKITSLFEAELDSSHQLLLGELIYSTERVLELQHMVGIDAPWYKDQISRLLCILKSVGSKYTRKHIRALMPEKYSYVIDELLHADTEEEKEAYYSSIIDSIVAMGIADDFILQLCSIIRRCAINRLHIIGDIFDRGPHPDIVMEELMQYPHVDIQWGNHDIHWMGAAAGSACCVASVIRLAMSYNNFDLIEDGYGINLRPLSAFASTAYQHDPCERFMPHLLDDNLYDPIDAQQAAKMHKAIAIIQFKLEGQLLQRHPEYHMAHRVLLTAIDYQKGTVLLEGTEYPLLDRLFPTIDEDDPLKLTAEEEELVHTLVRSFTHSPQLKKHIRFLYNHGSMYRISDGNLMYHGCIPMEENGEFRTVIIKDTALSGRPLLDRIDQLVREAYYDNDIKKKDALDFMWYLWCAQDSPLYGKSKMSTFERYFIEHSEAHLEISDPYYSYTDSYEACCRILKAFGLDPQSSRIINGHVPVKTKAGESPVKAKGLLYVIDGGISKAYQSTTGIGGYTLVSNSHYLALAAHRPFELSRTEAFGEPPSVQIVARYPHRLRMRDTDAGKEQVERIHELQGLLAAYQSGRLNEH